MLHFSYCEFIQGSKDEYILLPLPTYANSCVRGEHSGALYFWKQCLESLVLSLVIFVWPTDCKNKLEKIHAPTKTELMQWWSVTDVEGDIQD